MVFEEPEKCIGMKNWIFLFFLLMVIFQWMIPANLVWQSETTISKGQVFKFKVRPVDPNDPFRGKYIILGFEANSFAANDSSLFYKGQQIFVRLGTDENGFAKVTDASPELYGNEPEWVTAKITHLYGNQPVDLFFEYPFDKFFMEESKAPAAEKLYAEATQDSARVVYAIVNIHNGNGVLEDVMIDGQSISKWVEEQLKNPVSEPIN